MRSVEVLSVDIVELLPIDEPELDPEFLGIVELLLPLGIVELLPMPEFELDEPLEVVDPVDDGAPLDGCERSPCDRPPAGAVVDEDGIVDDELLGVIVEPEPDCCTGVPSLRRLWFADVGEVVVGLVTVAEGVVAVPVAVVAGADIVELPVLDWPCSDCVGEPSFRALSLADVGAVVVGAGVVADGVVGVVCAEATPIEATSAAAAAAVLNSLNEVIEILLMGDK